MKKILMMATLLFIGNEIISLAVLCVLVACAVAALFKCAAEGGY